MNEQVQSAEPAPEEPKKEIAVRPPREIRVVESIVPVLDTGKFEQMQRIASVMASMSLIPESLCMFKENKNSVPKRLPDQTVVANCFMVVNQAVNWKMDPFAVAQCGSVIHGRLCWEGKLIAAVIENSIDIRLNYKWTGDEGKDNRTIVVSGKYPDEAEARTISGTVGGWKTTGDNSPWQPKQYDKMLAYRGAREWARLHAPGVILGVYSFDEMEGAARGEGAIDVTPISTVPPAVTQGGPPPVPKVEIKEPEKPKPLPEVLAPKPSKSAPPRSAKPYAGPPPVPKQVEEAQVVDKPTAGERLVSAAKEAAGMIEPMSNDEADDYLRDLEKELGECGNLDAIEELWRQHIQMAAPRMLKPDQQKALGFYSAAATRALEAE